MTADPLPFNPDECEIYCLIASGKAARSDCFHFLTEGVWRNSGEGDLWFRIDSSHPQMLVQRHVHIAHKKQMAAPRTQVSWNADGSRHDAHNFNSSFSPLGRAKDLARKCLKLPDNFILENAELSDVYGRMLTEATELAGVSYTAQNLFVLRFPN